MWPHLLNPSHWPLSVRVILAMLMGVVLGLWRGTDAYIVHIGNADLGQLGLLIIRLLKALAIPLILFSILDAFIKTRISARSGGRLIVICLGNATIALLIGLGLMNLFKPGLALRGHLDQLLGHFGTAPLTARATLDPLQNLAGFLPQSLLEPFVSNNVIAVVLIALVFGAAISALNHATPDSDHADWQRAAPVLALFISGMNRLLTKVLGWVVQLVPFAVMGLVAQAVGKAGLGIFSELAGYIGIISLGLCLHALIYYPSIAWLLGGMPASVYLGRGADAVLTGLSTNSSLATVPVTLCCLKAMGVHERSARLAACAGTNLNNDGVTLYEAMTALFLAQAIGFDLDVGQQIVIVLAAWMAAAGIAGVPEAGLIVLPLVLSAAGLPETVVAAAIPLIAPIDWFIARLRSAVNVLSDMLVAILLDRWDRRDDSRDPLPPD
jgi:DAACS family dicarboxylate/amino acid:cation (Na+ or H+) symporter